MDICCDNSGPCAQEARAEAHRRLRPSSYRRHLSKIFEYLKYLILIWIDCHFLCHVFVSIHVKADMLHNKKGFGGNYSPI